MSCHTATLTRCVCVCVWAAGRARAWGRSKDRHSVYVCVHVTKVEAVERGFTSGSPGH